MLMPDTIHVMLSLIIIVFLLLFLLLVLSLLLLLFSFSPPPSSAAVRSVPNPPLLHVSSAAAVRQCIITAQHTTHCHYAALV
jgi:hypothetical protein